MFLIFQIELKAIYLVNQLKKDFLIIIRTKFLRGKYLLFIEKDKNAQMFINEYKEYLSRSLVLIITTIDPDAIVFGGGISNEIDFLDEIKNKASKYINESNLKTVFLKPKYGDASGVRGAAILSRQNSI